MPRPPRYLGRKYMEPSRSSILNWERQWEASLLKDHGTCRYHHVSGHVIRNPRKQPQIHKGSKP